ncbi:hypothetical protein ILUMI_21590 [Ignelater luminosus]|uniref:R3H domain-containing protein n=1 Tax=Ignelater luminosus TaxID=2038154 RepID=A0A8K0CIH1_IGNLU|nr:hypothetical protein ILUMI_21590 [Ignelater luminosus]
MTVISRKQQNYDYPNSNNGSDTESLHLQSAPPSDTESVHSEPIEPLPIPLTCRAIRVPVYEEFGCLKRNSGKRKQRRFKNRSDLQTLSEEDEDDAHLVKLVDDYKGPFARLLENKSALQFWNEFTALPEEDQAKLTESVPKQAVPQNVIKPDDPMLRISSKIKRAMKIKKHLPMELIEKIEEDLINYFTIDPQGVFFSTPVTSFERLLLHAIAQYHNLRSISYFGDMIRNVEVYANKKLWAPMEVRFCDFVEKLRQ